MDKSKPTFIDTFAGAGGLSLGLMKAGWKGLFAVEKSPMAFQTLKHNLIDQKDDFTFDWPDWLPKEAIDIQTLLEKYEEQLRQLENIPLLAGGPPCQGFSSSGRRQYDDERNKLFEQYLKLVKLIRPQMLLVENVQGFAKTFSKTEKGKKGEKIQDESFNANKELQKQLVQLGYMPFPRLTVKAKDFGIPQLRPRYILIAIRKDLLLQQVPLLDPFQILYESIREKFLEDRGLPKDREVTLHEAISDLERVHGDVPCIEPDMKDFRQGTYGPTQNRNPYQKLMRQTRDGKPIRKGKVADSHRFVNHKPEIKARFARIISEFRPGIQLSDSEREQLGLNKHRIAPLAPGEACHTLTSLPDDLVHYSEPRIPTVREYARIQSFPDWFEFKAKYTTGDKDRREQVPRYTQVANAVPPLLGEAIGLALQEYLARMPLSLKANTSHSVSGEGLTTINSEGEYAEDVALVEADILGAQLSPVLPIS
jgi:DNA (cytosine-5)-methyltransferase 1